MKILSLNCRVWTRDKDPQSPHYWKKRYKDISDFIKEENPDVLCLQEFLFPCRKYIKGYRKVGVGFTHPIFVRKGIKAKDYSVRIHWSSCRIGDLRIINVHGRWNNFIVRKVIKGVNSLIDGLTVACGDFNVGINSLSDINLSSARVLLGMEQKDTFQNYTKEKSHGEIDHFLVNVYPEAFWIDSHDFSDHRAIFLVTP